MKKLRLLLILLLAAMLSGCAGAENSEKTIPEKDTDTIYQIALLQSLTLGEYDGSMPVREWKTYGDTGIGTFDRVNGEMIVLDGVVYQALGDGSVVVADENATIPFSNISYFDNDIEISVSAANMKEIREILDNLIANHGSNQFYLIKMPGNFTRMEVRSELEQSKPYKPLTEVLAADQRIFDYINLEGTIVGLYCPSYMNGLNTPGWHFHFISEDKAKGGHVLDFTLKEGTISLDKTSSFQMCVPDNKRFNELDLSVNLQSQIQKVEGGK